MIEQILRFGKGNHLPRDEESVIIQDGLDGQPFSEGSEAPTLQPAIDRLRREKREREAKKQAKHAQQVLKKRQRTLDAFVLCPLGPMWLRQAPISLNPLSPRNPLWLHNLNTNPILTARERREPLLHNRNHACGTGAS